MGGGIVPHRPPSFRTLIVVRGKEGMVQRQPAVSDEVGVIGGMGWGWRDGWDGGSDGLMLILVMEGHNGGGICLTK